MAVSTSIYPRLAIAKAFKQSNYLKVISLILFLETYCNTVDSFYLVFIE